MVTFIFHKSATYLGRERATSNERKKERRRYRHNDIWWKTTIATRSQQASKYSLLHAVMERTIHMQLIKIVIECRKIRAGQKQVTSQNIDIQSHNFSSTHGLSAFFRITWEWHVKPQSVVFSHKCKTAAPLRSYLVLGSHSRIAVSPCRAS